MTHAIAPAPTPPDCDHLLRAVYGDLQRFGPAHFHERRIVRRLLAPLDVRSLLDVGCGNGSITAELAAGLDPGAVAGLDLSEVAIAEARRRLPGSHFFVHDIQRSIPDGRWDLVHCSLVLHLIPDDRAAIRHLRACTGRYLLVSTMTGDFDRYRRWETHLGAVRNYRRGELEAALALAGFRIRESVSWGFPFFSPLARTLQNRTRVGSGRYGAAARLIAASMRTLFYLNSARGGDLLVILAEAA